VKHTHAIGLVALAGMAGAVFAADGPREWERGQIQAADIGHIYYNIVTGEKVLTLTAEGVRPASSGSEEVWIADNRIPCAAYGQTNGHIAVFDDPAQTTSAAIGAFFKDWGEIQPDTVIDCVGISWTTAHADTDTNSDGFGDGVRGFGSRWYWFDADVPNNWSGSPERLIDFTLYDLPGDLEPLDGVATTYFATLDLASSFSSSMSFEFLDTDFDPQDAAVHNPGVFNRDFDSDTLPDGDSNQNGLGEFSYVQRFYQPGTTDFDGDTLPDGNPANQAIAGVSLVAPSGPAVQRPDGSWAIDPVAPPPAAQGLTDFYEVYTDVNGDGYWEPVGTFWSGGISCDANGDGTTGDTRPYAQFYHKLYGPRAAVNACIPDVFPPPNGDGVLNFFDVSYYLGRFIELDPVADIAPFPDGDGQFNFFDIAMYLNLFGAGCP
jgi:hypothetical protein